MIKLKHKEIDECGWAGPLLWVCTTDGYSVHLYDAPIFLKDKEIEIGTEINDVLKGQTIKSLKTDKENFTVTFITNDTLSINSQEHETARVFKQKGKEPHCVYENREFNCD